MLAYWSGKWRKLQLTATLHACVCVLLNVNMALTQPRSLALSGASVPPQSFRFYTVWDVCNVSHKSLLLFYKQVLAGATDEINLHSYRATPFHQFQVLSSCHSLVHCFVVPKLTVFSSCSPCPSLIIVNYPAPNQGKVVMSPDSYFVLLKFFLPQ